MLSLTGFHKYPVRQVKGWSEEDLRSECMRIQKDDTDDDDVLPKPKRRRMTDAEKAKRAKVRERSKRLQAHLDSEEPQRAVLVKALNEAIKNLERVEKKHRPYHIPSPGWKGPGVDPKARVVKPREWLKAQEAYLRAKNNLFMFGKKSRFDFDFNNPDNEDMVPAQVVSLDQSEADRPGVLTRGFI